MLNRLILKVTKFQLPPLKRLGTVVKNIFGGPWPPMSNRVKHANSKNDANSKNQNTALKKTLNIYSLNINGLLSHKNELRVFIDDHRSDIICINETKTDDKIHDSDTEVDNYLLVRKDRN